MEEVRHDRPSPGVLSVGIGSEEVLQDCWCPSLRPSWRCWDGVETSQAPYTSWHGSLRRLHGTHLVGDLIQLAPLDKPGWNQWDATICSVCRLPRSSNLAEGWHNGFKSLVTCTNTTMWSFLDALKLEHSLNELKIANHLTMIPPPSRLSKEEVECG